MKIFNKPKNRHTQQINIESLPLQGEEGLIDQFDKIPDHRFKRGIRHPLSSILSMSTCAILSGACTYEAIGDWVKKLIPEQLKLFGNYREKGPSETCIRRTMQQLDQEAFLDVTTNWVMNLEEDPMSQIMVDGKTIKGSKKKRKKTEKTSKSRKKKLKRKLFDMVHLFAVCNEKGEVISQIEVDKKTNEIPALMDLLDPLDIKGRAVSADALHTQRKSAKYIVEEKEADYFFTVKDNQPNLKESIQNLHLDEKEPDSITNDRDHGRIEVRKIWSTTEVDNIDFPHANQVGIIERITTDLDGSNKREEKVCFITSLNEKKANSDKLLSIARKHWGIENKVHYVRDVTFDEDRTRIRTGNGPKMMAALKNLAITLWKKAGATVIPSAMRMFERWDKGLFRLVGISLEDKIINFPKVKLKLVS